MDNLNVYNGHYQNCNSLNLRHKYVQQHKRYSFLPLVCSMSTAAGFDVLASNLPDYLNKFNRSLFVPFSLFLGRSFPIFPFVLLNGTPFSVGAQKLPTSSKLFTVNACHIFVLFHSVSLLECTFVML